MINERPVHCTGCGRALNGEADAAEALSWAFERRLGESRWLCPDCVRHNVRDIEAKLPPDFW